MVPCCRALQSPLLNDNLPIELLASINELGPFRHKAYLLHFLHDVFQNYSIKLVALFGSVVRKTDTEKSDLDVFLVAENFPAELGSRLDALYHFMIPHVDFRAHTIDEFHLMMNEWHLTILEVCYDHCIIFDPDQLGKAMLEKFTRNFNEHKLIRGDHYWKIMPAPVA